MSHFELRDAMATSGSGTSREFSGRVADVFSKLGSGLVKTDQESVEKVRNIKPDFDQQQLKRMKMKSSKQRDKDDTKSEFKKPKSAPSPGQGRHQHHREGGHHRHHRGGRG